MSAELDPSNLGCFPYQFASPKQHKIGGEMRIELQKNPGDRSRKVEQATFFSVPLYRRSAPKRVVLAELPVSSSKKGLMEIFFLDLTALFKMIGPFSRISARTK